MGKIVEYSTEIMRDLSARVSDYYKRNLTQMLTFEKWKQNAMSRLYSDPKSFGVTKIAYDKPVRIARPTREMLEICKAHQLEFDDIALNAPVEKKEILLTDLCRKILEPQLVIDRPEGFSVASTVSGKDIDVPVWFNSTLNCINVRFGYGNMDSATPGAMVLGDESVHGMLGGRTGAGKSVALNTCIASLMLEYPPWELDIYLADFKIVELSRYAEPIAAPHVKMVAATESTEFALSLFETLISEMEDRQALFKITGVQKLADFRKKFNLVVPRVILIADEFVQMYENIKKAVEKGNDNADEQKALIGSKISAIARLGRSMGLHMLLSSQNMDGSLDEQTIGQFKAGFSLAADTGVSNVLIGNDAAAGIKGKGKGILNMDKGAKNPDENVMTRVPYIQSEQSEEDIRQGKSTYLQAFLLEEYKMAEGLGFNKGLFYYNEDNVIPFVQFTKDLEFADYVKENPRQGSAIADDRFREETAEVLIVGKEVKFSRDPVAYLPLKFRRSNNIAVAATLKSDRLYMLQLIARNLSRNKRFQHYIIKADETLFLESGLTDLLDGCNVTIQNRAVRPQEVIDKVKNRQQLLDVSSSLVDANGTGEWDGSVIFPRYLPKESRYSWHYTKEQLDELLEAIHEQGNEFIKSDDLRAWLSENNAKDIEEMVASACTSYYSMYLTYQQVTKGKAGKLTGRDLSSIVLWIIGADELPDMVGYDNKSIWKWLFEIGPSMGVFTIMTAQNWMNVGEYVEFFNSVWDKSDKTFFMACGLPKRININANSFQITDRETRESRIIRQYKIT